MSQDFDKEEYWKRRNNKVKVMIFTKKGTRKFIMQDRPLRGQGYLKPSEPTVESNPDSRPARRRAARI